MGSVRIPSVLCVILVFQSVTALNGQIPVGEPVVAPEARRILADLTPEEVPGALPALRNALHRDHFGWTPLMIAAAVNPYGETITAMIAAGENPRARSLDDMTPLMFAAAFSCEPRVVQALVDGGAEVDARTRDNWVPGYGVARFTGEAVQFNFLQGAAGGGFPAALGGSGDGFHEEEEEPAWGWTALFMAVRYNGDGEMVRALLEAGADPYARDEAGEAALPAGWMEDSGGTCGT